MIIHKVLSTPFFLFAVAALFLLCGGNALGATIYVPDQYPTIQQAIDAAFAGDRIIVRDGTHLLTTALDFNGKAITVISQNGPSNCILDGQNLTRIAYFHRGETSSSVLSGFTIQNGKADKGGAIYCEQSSPIITQCTIRRNNAVPGPAYGGGIYLKSSSASITYCQISDNNSVSTLGAAYGGGIFSSASSPNISNSTISGNMAANNTYCSALTSSYGGGAYFEGGSPVIREVSIVGNISSVSLGCTPPAYGGGIYFRSSSPFISNTIIRNNSTSAWVNSASSGGGVYALSSFLSAENSIINGNSSNLGAGIYLDTSSATLTNCTFARNIATTDVGAVGCANSSPQVVNCILWEDSPNEIVKSGTGNPTVTYSDVMGGYTGTGNINSNPLFLDIAGQDFHLKSSSPCVNVGNNSAQYLPNTDKDGNPRILGATVDMGAYEYASCLVPGKAALISPSATNTGAMPAYVWNAVPNATWYFLWVNDTTGTKVQRWFTSAQAGCAGGGTCSVTPQIALTGGVAQWWVQTWSDCGYGPWSDGASFTAGSLPGTAVLISPTGSNISPTPTYIWNAVSTATYYMLWVTDYTGSPRMQSWYSATQANCPSGTGTCSVTPGITLVPGRAQWWIMAYNPYGYGSWSDTMPFTVAGTGPLSKPVLVSPTGAIATASPTFRWNAVVSATWYWLYVQDSASFAWRISARIPAVQAGCGSGTCSFTPNTSLAPGAAIWWVQPSSDLGTGPWSDGMSFTVPGASGPSLTP